MNAMNPLPACDLLLKSGRVFDPAQAMDQTADVAIRAGRIMAVGPDLAVSPRHVLTMSGALVCPGFIDIHVHAYEWVTNFGVPADDAGIHSGATTIVDQGSAGAWTFGGFKAFIADPARTDVRSFVSINLAGALKGGMEGPKLHNPGMVSCDELVKVACEHPSLVRGIKCHGESGALSYWGTTVLEAASTAGREADIPLYIHTGELFPVIETSRPDPSSVLPMVLPWTKPGDILAHIYSSMPDGIMGPGNRVPDIVRQARDRGILFDLGHGINFSFRIARAMMEAGIFADTLGSDVHGDFNSYHDFSQLDYSLIGGLNKLLALGMPLATAIAGLTLNPARILRDETIGSLRVGSRANITVLKTVDGDWRYIDAEHETIRVKTRLVPEIVVLDGEPIVPRCNWLIDVLNPAERSECASRKFTSVPQARTALV